MKSNQSSFPKKWKSPKNPDNWGPQLPPSFPSHHSAKCPKKFQSSSSLLKPVTPLVRLKPHRWHCYCIENFWKIVNPITRVHSGIGIGTDLGSRVYPATRVHSGIGIGTDLDSRVYPVIGLKELNALVRPLALRPVIKHPMSVLFQWLCRSSSSMGASPILVITPPSCIIISLRW
jgi:hypothetical protein